jgi:hypothetical protein
LFIKAERLKRRRRLKAEGGKAEGKKKTEEDKTSFQAHPLPSALQPKMSLTASLLLQSSAVSLQPSA